MSQLLNQTCTRPTQPRTPRNTRMQQLAYLPPPANQKIFLLMSAAFEVIGSDQSHRWRFCLPDLISARFTAANWATVANSRVNKELGNGSKYQQKLFVIVIDTPVFLA